MTQTAVAYARYSSDNQRVESITAQLRASESRRKKRRRHKQREPLGAVLFGSYYYWYKVNHQLSNQR